MQGSQIETRKMKDLQNVRIAQQSAQIGRVVPRAVQLHQMRVSVTGGQLHQAQRIALRIEAHRFRVDGYRSFKTDRIREIAFVQRDRHDAPFPVCL